MSWLRRLLVTEQPTAASRPPGLFSTHVELDGRTAQRGWRETLANVVEAWPKPKLLPGSVGMDANDFENSIKGQISTSYGEVPEAQVAWYGAQGFIGWQMCSLLMQHWLIDKACSMPAKDAVRKGYDITVNDGTGISADILDYIREQDEAFDINYEMIEFLRMGRCFGIRIARFVVDSNDPDYYKKPFNIDGVEPGSYRGIAQIDPYWITPLLTTENAATPGSIGFYRPEFWQVSGLTVHRSHLVIYTTGQVPDVLKPAYFYAGVSIPQRVYERVYAAERTANEAPQLAMTKRLTIMHTDLEDAISNQAKFDQRLLWWTQTRDNYGVKINGIGDKIEQFDLSLTDLDAIILTQYQLVAAIAEVPGTKLLGTQPKGFNSTGEFEESSYHETLESFQSNDLSRLLKRHHELIVKSLVMPKFGITKPFKIVVSWNALDALTEQEKANVNLIKSQNDEILVATGIIETADARKRIVNDPDSGYNGLSEELPAMPDTAPTPNNPSGASGVPSDPADPKATLPDAKPPMPRVPATPKAASA